MFTYYRWHGWLREERTADNRMRLAPPRRTLSQQSDFVSRDGAACQRGAASWTAQEMDVSDGG